MKLDPSSCRRRQARLLAEMENLGVANAVLCHPAHVLYLTGFLTSRLHKSAVVLRKDGRCYLVSCAAGDDDLAMDQHVPYEASALATLRMDQAATIAEAVSKIIGKAPGAAGLDKGDSSAFLGEMAQSSIDLGPVLIRLRRKKDTDELAIMHKGIEITHAAYVRARAIIAPGISELELYAELRKAAVLEAGEDLPVFGNDFQSASSGGPPRDRKAGAGELWVLDLGPQYAGYYADNCRTFAVDGSPTQPQLEAWRKIAAVLSHVEKRVKPGVSCSEIFEECKEMLDSQRPGAFFHHLGHGVGLSPHEQPNLNPHWDHYFEEGDFFTAEPGLYYDELKAGIRLEENYLVTTDGLRKLTSFPLEL